jgi:hypothetical protein
VVYKYFESNTIEYKEPPTLVVIKLVLIAAPVVALYKDILPSSVATYKVVALVASEMTVLDAVRKEALIAAPVKILNVLTTALAYDDTYKISFAIVFAIGVPTFNVNALSTTPEELYLNTLFRV